METQEFSKSGACDTLCATNILRKHFGTEAPNPHIKLVDLLLKLPCTSRRLGPQRWIMSRSCEARGRAYRQYLEPLQASVFSQDEQKVLVAAGIPLDY